MCRCIVLSLKNRERKGGKLVGNTTIDRVFETTFLVIFSLCNLDGSGKILKLLCDVWKEVIFKKQNDFKSCLVIVWAIDVDDVISEGCKRPVEEHKRIEQRTFIVSLLPQVIVDRLKYSLSSDRFWSFNYTASAMYFQVKRKIKVDRDRSLCLVSKVIFDKMTTGGADNQNNKGQCRVKK